MEEKTKVKKRITCQDDNPSAKERLSTIVFYDPLVIQLNGLKCINALKSAVSKTVDEEPGGARCQMLRNSWPLFPFKTYVGSHEYGKSQRSEISFTPEFHGLTKSIIQNCKSTAASQPHTHTNIQTHRDLRWLGFTLKQINPQINQ